MTTTQSTVCQREGCTGRYEDVGDGQLFCASCGVAPAVAPDGTLNSPPTEATTPGGQSLPDHGTAEGDTTSSRRQQRTAASSRGRQVPRQRTRSPLDPPRPIAIRGVRSASVSSGRGTLGAGLVTVPQVARPEPRTAVLSDPRVPEHKRYCGRTECAAPVGRARGSRPGRVEGFCTQCGRPYSFVPKLRPGDLVHGQYEVAGCLAHGGLGWIYLAVDHAVADRWVVLKGLLDTGDEDALAAAVSERRFLAEIEHSTIVRIYNFVEHLDQRTGNLDGYIVMEYVSGPSLKEIANSRQTPDGRRDPLPVEHACAYALEALDALGHLHSRHLLYCDFKIDNAIQQHDRLKLIDMGAVRRKDDTDSAVYGTRGYQAPEVPEAGPSVASDLYTVARALAVLTFDFSGYTNIFATSLPAPEHIEVFRQYESFYRLLVRATDPDPGRRFASAEEMSEQLTGVLREVVALRTGRPRPSKSTLFGPELSVVDTQLLAESRGDTSLLGARADQPSWFRSRWKARTRRTPVGAGYGKRGADAAPTGGSAGAGPAPAPAAGPLLVPFRARDLALALPVPQVDPDDPNAGFLAGLMASTPADMLTALRAAPVDSVERRLRALRALLEMDPAPEVSAAIARAFAELEVQYADDWRVVWYRGLATLIDDDRASAALTFDAVYDAFPGEPSAKLALAVCAESLGRLDDAAAHYRLVSNTDPSYVSATFGLARVRLAAGNRPGAVQALESVPETSIHYTAARIAAVRARLRQRAASEPLREDLYAAGEQIDRLSTAHLDPVRRERLRTEVLGSALDWVLAGRQGEPAAARHGREPPLLGCALDERELRVGLERAYRLLARLAHSGAERIELVERANRFRPRTWV